MNNADIKSKTKTGKRIFRWVLLLGTIISLYFVPWLLVKAWILPLPNSIQKQADQAIDYGFKGLIVYVQQQDNEPKFFTSGWHNPTLQIPAEKVAYFKIGSINKLYVAVAVTKLVSAGRLSFDKTLADYLPPLVGRIENAETITLKMLVQHRSGIPNFTDTPNYWTHPKATSEEKLRLILDQPADFEPGKRSAYCNTNYLLLNIIMDSILGYPNFEFIRTEILEPLHLQNTFATIHDVNIENVMSGYHKGHDADLKTDDVGMVATAEDVGIFLRALNNDTLLTEQEQKIYPYKYEHSGWVPGYQSFAAYYKDIDAVMVTLYSTTDHDLILWNLAEILNKRFAKIIKRHSKK